MPFVAQIDLAEARAAMAGLALPAEGHLWLFATPTRAGAHAVVIHRGAGASRVPREGDDDAEPCHVELEAYEDLPDPDDLDELRALLGERAESYHEVRDHLEAGRGRAVGKLLGRPRWIQSSMTAELEQLAPGARWSLLFQIDADDRFDWGDAGTLYVWIRDDDLAAHRFDRVHARIDGF